MTSLMPDLTVEVYNADYRVLARITWQQAVQLILRGAVHVIDLHRPAVHIHGPTLVIELPMAVALREYVHIPHRAENRVTREGVLRRDANTCVYCGRRAETVDHVLPKSRGGAEDWFNLVASCQSCNGRKGNRTPQEAGMTMIREPFEPRQRDKFRRAPLPVLS
ncbi:MAG: HNH endonuclease [Mycobacterium sp.]|nr:HNH endonuclease [Mycobacterium sp.]